jgi:methylthioribose-1-phosphate isomerase
MKTLDWNKANCELILLDQRVLPGHIEFVTCSNHLAVVEAIKNMTVRGAPAIGAVAAYGLAVAACQSKAPNLDGFRADLRKAAAELNAARPTAVNLAWAVQRMLKVVEQPFASMDELREKIIGEADIIADEDIKTNMRISDYGEPLIDDGDTIIHHCNTGALATVDWGTALGVIRRAYEKGKRIRVLVDETRPRLQGARLTAWELQQYGIPYEIISDNAAGFFLHSGQVQKVFFGADRVAANGDVANKIGSYMLALAAHDNDVPVYSVFPSSTVDLSLQSGDLIPIEERDPDEVLGISMHGQPVAPQGAKARNPAFDVTPHRLLTGLITEKGVIYPPFNINLHRLMQNKDNAQ